MAAHVPPPPGLPQLLRAGARLFSGPQESLFTNIAACRALALCLRPTYGPLGRSKLVVDPLGRTLYTAHAGTILRSLELENPVARLLAGASQAQAEEAGDGAGAVVLLVGALLDRAEQLLRAGLPAAAVREGYEAAGKEALRLLPSLACHGVADLRDVAGVAGALRAAVGCKLAAQQDFLARLVARGCAAVLGPDGSFQPDHLRVCKVPGGGVTDSHLLEGLVFRTEAESRRHRAEDAPVAVYCCPFGFAGTEAKGTALFRAAGEMQAFGDAEEGLLEGLVRALAEAGAAVVVAGGRVDPLALHHADRLGLLVVRLGSRLELRRLCRAVGATPLTSLAPPPPGALGRCRLVELSEIGGAPVVVFHQEGAACPLATLVMRGATEALLCSLEEAVTDGVNVYKALVGDRRLVPGAGATEMALAVRLEALAGYAPGPEQYGILEFARALKTLPATLVENAGRPVAETMAELEALHQLGRASVGVRPGEEGPPTMDTAREGVLESLRVKQEFLRLATHTATTLLGVSHVLVAKKSGGPKLRGDNPNWDQEPDALE